MNITAFHETERTIHLDTHRWSQAVMLISLVILLGFGVWLSFGSITQTLVSDNVAFMEDGSFSTRISLPALMRVQMGQEAVIALQLPDSISTLVLPAEVVRVFVDEGDVRLIATATREQSLLALSATSGTVTLITGRYTPLELILKALVG